MSLSTFKRITPFYKVLIVLIIGLIVYFSYLWLESKWNSYKISVSQTEVQRLENKIKELNDKNSALANSYNEVLNSYKSSSEEIKILNDSTNSNTSKLKSINSKLELVNNKKQVPKFTNNLPLCESIKSDLHELGYSIADNYCERFK